MAIGKDQRCAVCGYVLDLVEFTDSTSEWAHNLTSPHDHPVVPVDRDLIIGNNRCDFCHAQGQTPWLILADSFIMWQTPDGSRSDGSRGHWAACEPCKELVARKRWTELYARNVSNLDTEAAKVGTWARNYPGRRAVVLTMWRRLEAHMNGIVPFAEERI